MTELDTNLLARIVGEVLEQTSTADVMSRTVEAARSHIPGAEHAGIALLSRRGELYTSAATSEMIRAIDRMEREAGEGPSLRAVSDLRPVRVDDLPADGRWPQLSALALSLGVRSVLAIPLAARGRALGALSVYAAEVAAFGRYAETLGSVMAAEAAVALALIARAEHLEEALESRDVIGQAKGILMERHRITAEQAFDRLVECSQKTNSKLRDVASRLSETGELPTVQRAPHRAAD